MTTRLSAKLKRLKKEGAFKGLSSLPQIRSQVDIDFALESAKVEQEKERKRNDPVQLEKNRKFKREDDAERIARAGHPHPYNYDEWVEWTSNNYIKSHYTVKMPDGTIWEHAYPNAGNLHCQNGGPMIKDGTKGIMVKLADTCPWF